jgi:hypothetical protein
MESFSFFKGDLLFEQRLTLKLPVMEKLTTVQIATVGLICSLTILISIASRYRHDLARFPGPRLASLTDFWRVWHVRSNRDRVTTADLHAVYGDVVRVGPRKISFANPQALKDIYGINKGYTKVKNIPRTSVKAIDQQPQSRFYTVAAGVSKGIAVPSLFSMLDETHHAKLRRTVNNIFALTTLVQYEPFVNSTITVFLDQLDKRFAGKDGPEGVIDFPLWLQFYAFDVIGELTYSTRHGFLDQGRDVDGIIAFLNRYMRYFGVVGPVSALHRECVLTHACFRSARCPFSTSCF